MKKMAKIATPNDTYLNWQGFVEKKPCLRTLEARLYTDVWVIGEVSNLGPYSFLNTLAGSPIYRHGFARPAVVFRAGLYAQRHTEYARINKDYEHYHGGDFTDEMAAIVSLFLGRRMKAGPVDREFIPGKDPLGSPLQLGSKGIPALPLHVDSRQIPRLVESCDLSILSMLTHFPKLSVSQSNALIKAARMYQQAIWICDADPSLAWLLLVSAIEITASEWAGNAGSLAERLKLSMPELCNLLSENSPLLIDPVAKLLVNYTKATQKFVDFLVDFIPEPPALRPSEFLQFPYTREAMKAAAAIIYKHRSNALHGGIAFPMPMCNPPAYFTVDGKVEAACQERIMGLATSTNNATWPQGETPMLLHVFEHIVRGAILNWFQALNPTPDSAAPFKSGTTEA